MNWSFVEEAANGTFAFSGYKPLPPNVTAAVSHVVPPSVLEDSGTGEWVQTYVAPRIVQQLAKLAPAFPGPDSSDEEYQHFWMQAVSAASFLAIVGCLLAVALPFMLCCCHPAPRTNRAGGPFMGPICASGCLTAVCLVIGVYRCYVAGASSFQIMSKELDDAQEDVTYLASSVTTLDTCGIAIRENLGAMGSFCSSWTWKATIQPTSGFMIAEINNFVNYTDEYERNVDGLPGLVLEAKEQTDEVATWWAACLLTPTVLAVIACILILAVVCKAECRGHHFVQRREKFSMPCMGCACIGPLILILGVLSTLQLSLGVAVSSACMGTAGGGVDQTVLSYASAILGNESESFNLTRYYITGVGTNQAAAMLKNSMYSLQQVSNGVDASKKGMYCTSSGQVYNVNNLTWFTTEATNTIDGCIRQVQPENLYPFYVDITHDMLCGSTVDGIFWLVCLEALLGFICLPMCTLTASMFLESMTVVRGQHYQGADLLEEDDENHAWYGEPM